MTTILIKKKDTAGAPAPGDLTNAAGGTEIAVNTATRRIYTKDSTGTVVELGNNATSSTIADLTVTTSTTLSYGTANQVQYLNASKLLVGSANLLFDGTTLTPNALTVTNAVTLSGGTANGVLYLNGSKVATSGSALVFDGTSLGVGTASPSGRLHVANTGTAGTTADNLAVYFSSTNRNSNVYILAKNTDGSTLNFGDGDSSTVGRISYDHASNYMAFDANGSEQMRLTSTGLGIGTSTPVSQLAVYSSSGTASGQYNSPSTITLWNGSTAGDIGGTIAFAGSILSTTAKSFFASISSSVQASDATGTTGRLIFSTKSTQAATTLSERMRINESGLVGIGTQSPVAQLHVSTNAPSLYSAIFYNTSSTGQGVTIRAGSTSSQDAFNCQTYDGGISLFTVQGGGSVGVGTGSPQARLQVNASNFALATSYNTQTSNLAVRTTNAQAANVGGEIALGGYNNDAATQVSDFARIHGKKENSTSTNVSGYFAVEVASDAGPAPYIFERMRITSAGDVGIGTTTPNVKFEVGATTQTGAEISVYTTNTSGGSGQRFSFWRNYTAGSSSPFRAAYIANVNNDDSFNSSNKQDMAFYTKAGTSEPAEQMRILSNGNLLVGTTSGTQRFVVSKSDSGAYVALFENTSGANANGVLISTPNRAGSNGLYGLTVANSGGNAFAIYTDGTYGTISDINRKKNVETARDGYLTDLCALRVVKYNWKEQEDSEPKNIGFIAQEVEQVFAGMVQTDNNGQKMLIQPVFIPILVKAIQEQQAIIESLKARLDAANL